MTVNPRAKLRFRDQLFECTWCGTALAGEDGFWCSPECRDRYDAVGQPTRAPGLFATAEGSPEELLANATEEDLIKAREEAKALTSRLGDLDWVRVEYALSDEEVLWLPR